MCTMRHVHIGKFLEKHGFKQINSHVEVKRERKTVTILWHQIINWSLLI
uniref:Uncharacterized protein n=1 Tax=Rhizophora mucronata TaxID=61149 RepID=A0A2P2PSR3_RHIMU